MDYESSNQTQDPQFNKTATDQGTADQNKKRGKAFFAIIGTILAMIVATMILAFQSDSFSAEKPKADFSRKAPKVTTPFKWSIGKKLAPADDFVAKLYITGTISESNESYNQKWIMETIAELKANEKNKGIILYINSPGGGVYQSDDVYLALMDYKTTGKPVYAYFGPIAASGGYYISCGADYIFAEPTTLTGSIGIFGMFPDFSQLATEKLGVKFDVVKTNRFSDFGSVARPFNAEELAHLQKYIGNGYDLFLSRVAEGRKMKTGDVNEIAQGRVWLGKDALKIKLIDDLRGLDKAVAKAAELAKVKDDYDTATYPAAPNFIDQMLSSLEGDNGNFLAEQLKASLGDYYTPVMMLKRIEQQYPVQARMPYHLVIR